MIEEFNCFSGKSRPCGAVVALLIPNQMVIGSIPVAVNVYFFIPMNKKIDWASSFDSNESSFPVSLSEIQPTTMESFVCNHDIFSETSDSFDMEHCFSNESELLTMYPIHGLELFPPDVQHHIYAIIKLDLLYNNVLVDYPQPIYVFIIETVNETPNYTILKSCSAKVIILGMWKKIRFCIGQKITLMKCSCWKKNSFFIIDNAHNFLFVEDNILSVSTFIKAFKCINQPKITSLIGDIDFKHRHPSLVYGEIFHRIIQHGFKTKIVNSKIIQDIITDYVHTNALKLYVHGTTKNLIVQQVEIHLQNITELINQFRYVEQTEYSVFSNLFGLKGNIDAVSKDYVIELKTGTTKDITHRAQLIYYWLIYNYEKNIGVTIPKWCLENSQNTPLLLYTYSREIIKNIPRHNEIASLIVTRNLVATMQDIENCNCTKNEMCKIYRSICELDDAHFLKASLLQLKNEYNNRTFYTLLEFNIINNQLEFECNDQVYDKIKDSTIISLYTFRKMFICKAFVLNSHKQKITIEVPSICIPQEVLLYTIDENDNLYKLCFHSLINIAYFIYFPEYYVSINDIQDNFIYNTPFILPGQNKHDTLSQSCNIKKQKSNSYIYDIKNNLIPLQPDIIPIPDMYKHAFYQLNTYQQQALLHAINCKHFEIIHGMPGTGKSTLIVLLIKILVFYNNKILLVSYTHLAINNILCKLDNINYYKICKTKQDQFKGMDPKNIKEFYDKIEVVAGTCYSFYDPIYIQRNFDYCIVDEGSQINLLINLIPISRCTKFVIVGDHLQISPINGVGLSLFEHLYTNYPCNELKIQYRMGNSIMRISNTMFYKNKMISGVQFDGWIKFHNTEIEQLNDILSQYKNEQFTILCYFNSVIKQLQHIQILNKNIFTIDKFQGSESDTIILLLDPITINECQLDPKRLNVALTRAKQKLIIIGNKRKMEEINIFKILLQYIINL